MIDEIGTIIAGFISGNSANRSKKVKVWASITIGLLFFLMNFLLDLFGRNPIIFDGVLVLIGLSLGISIAVYILLTISSKKRLSKTFFVAIIQIHSC